MIRDLIFKIIFFSGILFISIIFIPALLLPKELVLYGGRLFGLWTKICLKLIMSTKIIIKGSENIVKNEKFFIACSHQSMFETFYLQTIFNYPRFILKYELLKIPLFGWYLKKIGSISVNRNKVSKDNLGLIDKIKISVKQSFRPLIIFPQATRVLPNEKIPFKKGVGRIYKELGIKCQPVAINSGFVWPKKGCLIANKTITVSILEAINPEMDPDEFVNKIQNQIYSELEKLN